MPEPPKFLFATCQVGAEAALKGELGRMWPDFRFAYSRPGFLTFKLPPGPTPPDDLDMQSVFARAYGFSLGRATGATVDARSRAVWEQFGELPVEQLHVWPRDRYEPGFHDYEPGLTPESHLIADRILQLAPRPIQDAGRVQSAIRNPHSAMNAALVGDIVLVDEGELWVGYHRVRSIESSWPGGFFCETLPPEAVSRAYLKMREALVWSGFALQAGQRAAEIGCSPGGASQALLARGVHVLGVDPADMAPVVAGHPRFRHVRRRSKEVRRREFLGVDWLTCDVNLPPNYALDAIEAIVTYPGVRLRGMLLTLKLVEWSLAEKLPEYVERIRRWGFAAVRARQLHHNRREICVAAS